VDPAVGWCAHTVIGPPTFFAHLEDADVEPAFSAALYRELEFDPYHFDRPSFSVAEHRRLPIQGVFPPHIQTYSHGLTRLQLRDLVADAAAKSVVNEASEEQKERVRRLERVDAARRKETKMRQSAKKAGRSSKGWD
jgi:hypothetical protein